MLSYLRRNVDEIVKLGQFLISRNYPPFAPALALSPSVCNNNVSSYNITNIINDMRILLGVPKYRTSKPKKQTRKFSHTRLLTPADNLITCQHCGNYHEADTICKTCYSKVREITNLIKAKMMEYNPYKGESQDKGIFVKYEGEEIEKPEVVNGKRIIEIEKPRNSWFIEVIKSDKK
uniref:Large ribosomal subunit protein bL32m n=1 Tax=Parastrongyloides trichosuri TaxID=131310 RepID=A0A0N4ZX81_PARTI